jgi:hypothetical protein
MKRSYNLAKVDEVRRFEMKIRNKMFPEAKVRCLATIKKINHNNEILYQIEGQKQVNTNWMEAGNLEVSFTQE